MRRAGNAWVVGAHQHLHQQPDLVLVPVDDRGDKCLEILLDVRVILVGGNADVGAHAVAGLVELVAVEEDAPRALAACSSQGQKQNEQQGENPM